MSDLEEEASRLTAEIERIEAILKELAAAEAEFAHRARRVGDGLERLGGVGPELDAEFSSLAKNMKLNAADSEKHRKELQRLRGRLAEVEAARAASNSGR